MGTKVQILSTETSVWRSLQRLCGLMVRKVEKFFKMHTEPRGTEVCCPPPGLTLLCKPSRAAYVGVAGLQVRFLKKGAGF